MKKTVLIIEDDNDIRDIVSYILESEGFNVIATNPKPAIELPVHRCNIVLIDEWLNKTEGHMLCQEIKKIHQMQHLPVIILSTSAKIEEIAISCKADGFIRKPFELDELVNVVKKCLIAGTVA
ncbi:response regulator [Mucilaginibacter sp. HMF5004]|uniref:response regulator n=1 Tax=Mucilaginibacter rivuli TaxID=2857527 RepID=UPI001C6053D5|nr:response regulator [Mucilaginibacter rivuli]MBW4890773.1 response regulator [Mucilaginibacter rivuli]